ncbi:siderophore iron transporter [Colletotrichum truncatum]|uniref:Siderophore iron transporter n=1 Tax=Colletotrichum truncatum TaxID=5467 RepID=A0ACC3YSW8_COLTU|nr:siderophore iron transporter [Colletotrichum truncatum]KAF6799273.1 siderophore iron transporter [Colletotrichum truncatum]
MPSASHGLPEAKEKSVTNATASDGDAGPKELKNDTSEAMDEESIGALQQILSRRQQILMFTLIWIFQFAMAFSSGIFRVLAPYVTSSFQKHALTATTSVVASIASGIIKLPYARLLDIWGRPQCMTAMVVCTVVGTAMMAACRNVETYCAAQVLYNVGYYGIQFSMVVLITDSVSLLHRGFLLGFISTPSIVTIWAYGPATESILKTIGFRWGFGMWAILIPVFYAPLMFILFKYDRQARDAGLIEDVKPRENSSWFNRVLYYCKEFDVVGLVLVGSGLCLVLLAISIYSYQTLGWKSPLIISFLVVGFSMLVGFLLYEKFLAPATFLPWAVIKDRTVVFTNIMAAALYTSEFLCSGYIYSMLIVSFHQSVTQAAYISNIYLVGASFWNVLLGVAFRYNGRIKYYALFMGIPFFVLGQGLMISFDMTSPSIALMVVCKILISFGGGTIYPIEHMTLMAVSQAHFPALPSLESLIVDMGKGAGSAIATAIWTSLFRQKLAKNLPVSEMKHLAEIYGDLNKQSSYPIGSEARTAINRSYGETQRIIFISATALLAVAWGAVVFWRDIDVKKSRTSKKV